MKLHVVCTLCTHFPWDANSYHPLKHTTELVPYQAQPGFARGYDSQQVGCTEKHMCDVVELFKFEIWGVEQDLIPYVQQLVVPNVPTEG